MPDHRVSLVNFVSPLLFKLKDAPEYGSGFVAVLATWENEKRDRTGTLEAFEHVYDDDLIDKQVLQK